MIVLRVLYDGRKMVGSWLRHGGVKETDLQWPRETGWNWWRWYRKQLREISFPFFFAAEKNQGFGENWFSHFGFGNRDGKMKRMKVVLCVVMYEGECGLFGYVRVVMEVAFSCREKELGFMREGFSWYKRRLREDNGGFVSVCRFVESHVF